MLRNFIFQFLSLSQSLEGKYSVNMNSMKPFHCSGSCENQKLFGVCPADLPFAFNNGKMCCECQNEDADQGKRYKNFKARMIVKFIVGTQFRVIGLSERYF